MDNKPDNLAPQNPQGLPGINSREIFEETMRLSGWEKADLENKLADGSYADQRLNWSWMSWSFSRAATLIEVANWVQVLPEPLHREGLSRAIISLNKPTK